MQALGFLPATARAALAGSLTLPEQQLVEIAKAVGPRASLSSALARRIHVWKSFRNLTPSGVMGDARRSSPDKGERLMNAVAGKLAESLLSGDPWQEGPTDRAP